MTRFAFVVLALLAAACSSGGSGTPGTVGSGGSAGGGGSGGSGNGLADCQAACDLASQLACPNEGPGFCSTECANAYTTFSHCALQLDNAYACVKPLPLSAYECNSKGESELKAGYCDAETAAVTQCVLGG